MRLSAFQSLDVLFRWSPFIRHLVLDRLQSLLEKVLPLRPDIVLPKPHSVAKVLIKFSLESLIDWKDMFSSSFPKLQVRSM